MPNFREGDRSTPFPLKASNLLRASNRCREGRLAEMTHRRPGRQMCKSPHELYLQPAAPAMMSFAAVFSYEPIRIWSSFSALASRSYGL